MALRDEIERVLWAAERPLGAHEIAAEIGQDAPRVREALSAMYTHREVERYERGTRLLWALIAEEPWPDAVPAPPPEPVPYAPERSLYNEQVRVQNRVRRMLAAKRGEPEPMSGAPRGRS
jgi:hypothetical protein